ncbi:4Fe-4S dicluster domain-containing protein [Methanosalsum natronophilum]|uniref:4Fe-4S dicluster domain-containing protein n=1 Tax=Methanosalsum natronophilum TaxID=768733 RepID=A0A3R7YIS9_9EURY|nr:MAG: 4Fe-4S dicluster domain-containing protein [Methanosalsum natronophilum]
MFNSYLENTLEYYPENCINCHRCIQVCPHNVFTEGNDHVKLTNPTSCIECGACAQNCPNEAIKVEAGVGCAWAMIRAALKGKEMDSGECGCDYNGKSCC